jgi:hypothetical protein
VSSASLDPTLTNSPPKWQVCASEMKKGAQITAFGFTGTRADLCRFALRYRFAKSLSAITLDTYHSSTAAGYAALLRTFLMWGAFESYLRLICIAQNASTKFLAPHNPAKLDALVRARESSTVFYKFLIQFLNRENKRQVSEFIVGRPYNPTYLASSVRHVFAHGILTANPGGVDSLDLVPILDAVTSWHFQVLDADFSKRFT